MNQNLLNDQRLTWNPWSLEKSLAKKLIGRISELKPKRILELGSGTSTALIADYAKNYNLEFMSLEHGAGYYKNTRQLLKSVGLLKHVDLILAPLKLIKFGNVGKFFWYNTQLSGKFDFILIDGPPIKFGRKAALFALQSHFDKNWEIWLHDGKRKHEKNCIEFWSQFFKFSKNLDTEGRGAWILNNEFENVICTTSKEIYSKLGICFLTGQRIDLFRRTIESIYINIPDVLENCYTITLLNSPDAITYSYIKNLSDINECRAHKKGILPIGDGTSILNIELANKKGIEYILYVQDDWLVDSVDRFWLKQALNILDIHSEIGQVRLRHSDERVLKYHMITKNPITWEKKDGFLYSKSAHFTFNPSIIRTRDVYKIFPCITEWGAQKKFLKSGLATAQIIPGVFRHLGTKDQSLKLKVKKFNLR